ncbi:MAG: hypothetical protein Q7R76_05630 [Candidatus Woesearchaeota archaeon]|nr:hypothetical protein [Candidatus Woesearchaeota archaeon]
MDLIKITPDAEKAKNILKMILLLEERISMQDKTKMASLILVDYYEIVKELLTALLLLDGYKTLSHKGLIEYLQKKYPEYTSHDLSLLDDLRILRNRIAYEGFAVEPSYLTRNESAFKAIIATLKNTYNKR